MRLVIAPTCRRRMTRPCTPIRLCYTVQCNEPFTLHSTEVAIEVAKVVLDHLGLVSESPRACFEGRFERGGRGNRP